MIDLGKQWPLNISFFADKCKCLILLTWMRQNHVSFEQYKLNPKNGQPISV